MLVDHRVSTCRCIRVSCHIVVEVLGRCGDISLPEVFVVDKDQSFEVDGEQILGLVQLASFDRERKRIGQNGIGIDHICQRCQNVHRNKSAEDIMRVEIHIGTVCRVVPIEFELAGHIGLFFKGDRDTVFFQLRIDLVGDGLHDGLIAIVPNLDFDGGRPADWLRRCGRGVARLVLSSRAAA